MTDKRTVRTCINCVLFRKDCTGFLDKSGCDNFCPAPAEKRCTCSAANTFCSPDCPVCVNGIVCTRTNGYPPNPIHGQPEYDPPLKILPNGGEICTACGSVIGYVPPSIIQPEVTGVGPEKKGDSYDERLGKNLQDAEANFHCFRADYDDLSALAAQLAEALRKQRWNHTEDCLEHKRRVELQYCTCDADEHNAPIDAALAAYDKVRGEKP